jgi:archaellum component FlaC
MPKAKSRAITQVETQSSVWDFEEDPELFEVEVVPDQENNNQVTQMEARMTNMENAINRIVQHLEEVAQSHATEQ